MKNIETHNQFYKIDDIPVKEFEIKFNAIMENGETIDLSQQLPDWVVETFWSDENDDALINGHSEFVSKCCQIFGKDGNLPLSEIEDYAELHREESK